MTQQTKLILPDGQEIHLEGITINAQVGDQLFVNHPKYKKGLTVTERSWSINLERKPAESVLTILAE